MARVMLLLSTGKTVYSDTLSIETDNPFSIEDLRVNMEAIGHEFSRLDYVDVDINGTTTHFNPAHIISMCVIED